MATLVKFYSSYWLEVIRDFCKLLPNFLISFYMNLVMFVKSRFLYSNNYHYNQYRCGDISNFEEKCCVMLL